MTMKTVTILLAAGKGTRMRSKTLKVLHQLRGKPMLWHSLQQVGQVSQVNPVVIIGHQSEAVREAFGDAADYIVQEEQLGTGHAVLQAKEHLTGKADLVLVVYGDMPLLRAETFQKLIEKQKANDGPFSMLTIIEEDPRGFGRIVRNAQGGVEAIVEEVDCTPEQRAINELNVGVYCFQADWLWENLPNVPLSAKGEYYLTDTVALARSQGLTVLAEVMADPKEAMGINTRIHLSEAEAILRQRTNELLMLSGVTMIDPASTYIDAGVTIGQDTVIYPNTTILGETVIGEDCEVGPNTILRDARIGNQCKLFASVIEQATLEDHVDIGPFGHLRKGAHLLDGVHMGNFGEVKNATLGPGVKIGHFSYIGDATIKKNVNIGAGTITCNYDGVNKHHTTIEEDVFIGSDTMLVAPLHIGKGARTGAGAVVTEDVAENDTVVGVPARTLKKREQEGE
ncbi:MAG TPA: bifunctional UDP-N-acetylglucosamine diphosphorylase/glucosamine-1-phosphate N-acetyltransferase GlmU [Anaerolineales bacterium]|nr:bifunctional UDP-N-acetylglucosamine diphosphorylase/glucosamine-1-phosphate N-acetyltransferase GlmU [Anaerolineales bacterium]